MNTFLQDLRFSLRLFIKNPKIYIFAILALAIGLGLNAAMFSVVNQVLLSPLPGGQADRLTILHTGCPHLNIDLGGNSGQDFLEWRKQNQVFENMTAFRMGQQFTLTGREEPQKIKVCLVTPDYFKVVNTYPIHGRSFTMEEEQTGQEKTAILSHKLWVQNFASDPKIVGQKIVLDGEPFTVIGVMPPATGFLDDLVELFIPLTVQQLEEAKRMYFGVLALLKDGVSLEQANAEMEVIRSRLEQDYPEMKGFVYKVSLLQDILIKGKSTIILVLYGAVFCVLLIACANVANLLLAHSGSRKQEIAIRTAVGAGRSRVIRQLLTESLLLSFLGGALGLLFAMWGMDFLLSIQPKSRGLGIPGFAEIRLDNFVLMYTFLLSILTGLFFGLAPAMQVSKQNLNETLKESSKSTTGNRKRHRFFSMMVVSEIALSLVLLICAGLLIKNFVILIHKDPGFDANSMLSMQLNLPIKQYPDAQQRIAFFDRVMEKVNAFPGVNSAGIINVLPMTSGYNNSFKIEGELPLSPGMFHSAEFRVINDDYFRTMKIPLKNGRFFTIQDNGEGIRVVLINETMARKYFPNENPIGKQLIVRKQMLQIIGIVGDEQTGGWERELEPIMYQPYHQDCSLSMSLAIRTNLPPTNLASGMKNEIWAIDPDLPISRVKTMKSIVYNTLSIQLFCLQLFGLFSVLALLLASIGIYGVMSHSVSQRSHEIGIRMALGAQRSDILRLILKQGLVLILSGVCIGILAAFGMSRVIAGLLYDMSALDVTVFIFVPFFLAFVALMACYLPARKAAKTDPMISLRCE